LPCPPSTAARLFMLASIPGCSGPNTVPYSSSARRCILSALALPIEQQSLVVHSHQRIQVLRPRRRLLKTERSSCICRDSAVSEVKTRKKDCIPREWKFTGRWSLLYAILTPASAREAG
jgi:hypothetical protein